MTYHIKISTKIFLYFTLFSTLLLQGCITWSTIYYREIGDPETFCNDKIKQINSAYYDEKTKELLINFNANLKDRRKEKCYHISINLNKEKSETTKLKKDDTLKFLYDTAYLIYNNKYSGITKFNIHRKKIKNAYDTSTFNKLHLLSKQHIRTDHFYTYNDFNFHKIDKSDEIYINFLYFPDSTNNTNFYIIKIAQRKKWDKRYLTPLTLTADIITLPLQIIYGIVILIENNL